ncbi:MAG: IclR family transcriptional regulator [Desulfitobacteriaceae bacterium]
MSSVRTIQSVEKALEILKCFSIKTPELGVSELASRLGLYKSTVHRMIKTLEDQNFIVQNVQNQKYRLGFILFDLGRAVVSNLEVRNVALPYMQDLSVLTKETVTLNIVDNDERVCIEKVESTSSVRDFVQIGLRNPLFIASSGKLLLAYFPFNERERLISEKNLGVTVQGRLIETKALHEELELIVKNGYSFSTNERCIGTSSLAVPIRNNEGTVIAALSVSGPESRFTVENIDFLISKTWATAEKISQCLGWKAP